MSGSAWFYEIVWRWTGSQWVKYRDAMPDERLYYSDDPCGAFNPYGLDGQFMNRPPYKLYEVWMFALGQWQRCLTLRNWF